MVTIELLNNVPSAEEWERRMLNASQDEAIKLWQLSIECLHTKNQDQEGWGRRIGIAQRVLSTRGIPWR
jgi:hypothetical protein